MNIEQKCTYLRVLLTGFVHDCSFKIDIKHVSYLHLKNRTFALVSGKTIPFLTLLLDILTHIFCTAPQGIFRLVFPHFLISSSGWYFLIMFNYLRFNSTVLKTSGVVLLTKRLIDQLFWLFGGNFQAQSAKF
jgi:hypothetical protein